MGQNATQKIKEVINGATIESAAEYNALVEHARKRIREINAASFETDGRGREHRDKVFTNLYPEALRERDSLETFLRGNYEAQIAGHIDRNDLRDELPVLAGAPVIVEVSESTSLNNLSPEDKLQMKRAFENNPKLKQQMIKLGVKFDDNGDIFFPEGFEKTEEYKQIQRYIKALYMTLSPEYTTGIDDTRRKEKLQLYFDTIGETGDAVYGKEYLGYKLIHSIREDLKRDPNGPYILMRNGEKGQYAILKFPVQRAEEDKGEVKKGDIISGKMIDGPYMDLLKPENINSNYFDFAITFSLIEKNHMAFKEKPFFGQATLVRTLLAKHHITGLGGEDVQNPRLLLADWDQIETQIDAKLASFSTSVKGAGGSIEGYEELMYLKNLIYGKEYLDEPGNIRIQEAVNVYGKRFLKEKALIDEAFDLASGKKRGPGGKLADSIKDNFFMIAMGSLAMAIFGGKDKALGGKLFVGAIALMAGGELADDFMEETQSSEKKADVLELIKLRQITQNLGVQTKQQAVYELMVTKKNAGISEGDASEGSSIVENGSTGTYTRLRSTTMSNDKLGAIFKAATGVNDDIEFENGNTSEAANTLFTKLAGANNTSKSLELAGKQYEITKTDIEVFLRLLTSVTPKDSNLKDALIEGIHPDNIPYVTTEYLAGGSEFSIFNIELNTAFGTAYTNTKGKGIKRSKLIATQKQVKDILQKGIDADKEVGDINTKIAEVDIALKDNPVLQAAVKNTLEKYRAYAPVKNKISHFTGIFDKNKAGIIKTFATLFGVVPGIETDITWKTELHAKIGNDIVELEALNTNLASYATQEPFKSLVAENKKIIARLKEIQKDIIAEIGGETRVVGNPKDIFKGSPTITSNDIANLERDIYLPMKKDMAKVNSFIKVGEVTSKSIEDLDDAYERLESYTLSLAGEVAGTDPMMNALQQKIIDIRDDFVGGSSGNGKKAELENIIKTDLDSRFTKIEEVNTTLSGIDASNTTNIADKIKSFKKVGAYLTNLQAQQGSNPQRIKEIDNENRATLNSAARLLGGATQVGSVATTTINSLLNGYKSNQDIQDEYDTKKVEFEASIDTYITGINAPSMVSISDLKTAKTNIDEIQKAYPTKGVTQLTELQERYEKIATIADVPPMGDAIAADLVEIDRRMSAIQSNRNENEVYLLLSEVKKRIVSKNNPTNNIQDYTQEIKTGKFQNIVIDPATGKARKIQQQNPTSGALEFDPVTNIPLMEIDLVPMDIMPTLVKHGIDLKSLSIELKL